MKDQKIILLLLSSVLIIGAGLYLSSTKSYNTSLSSYSSIGITSDSALNQFKVKEATRKDNLLKINAEKGSARIELQVLMNKSLNYSLKYIRDKNNSINPLSRSLAAPYSGNPEKEVNCEKTAKPSLINSDKDRSPTIYYRLKADKWYNLESCATENTKYKAKYLVAYCPKTNKILDLRLFYENSQSINLTKTYTCQRL